LAWFFVFEAPMYVITDFWIYLFLKLTEPVHINLVKNQKKEEISNFVLAI